MAARLSRLSAAIEAPDGRAALPSYALSGIAWQGYVLDPEGNTSGIHQADPDAR